MYTNRGSVHKEICFVIMPFSKTTEQHDEKYWTNHFEKFLKPIIEENPKLEAYRSKALRGDILNDIIKNLINVSIVVADLTDLNANVFWELGVRQSFRHGTITIAEENTKLPFDISSKGTLFYSQDRIKNEDFRKNFREALKDCLINPKRPDSRILENLSGKGTFFERFQHDETLRRLDAIIAEIDRNEFVLTSSLEIAKKNRKLKRRLSFKYESTVAQMRLIAVELLLTDRYINANKSFYDLAEEYWVWFKTIGFKLTLWNKSPSFIEKNLIEIENSMRTLSNQFKDAVNKKQDEIALY